MRSKSQLRLLVTFLLLMIFPSLAQSFEPTPQQIQEAEQFRLLYPPLIQSMMSAIQSASGTGDVKTEMGNLYTGYSAEQMDDLKCFTQGHLNFVNNEQIETLARFLSDSTFSKEVFLRIAQDCNSEWLRDEVGQGFMLFGK